jgi:hypothetical protein
LPPALSTQLPLQFYALRQTMTQLTFQFGCCSYSNKIG